MVVAWCSWLELAHLTGDRQNVSFDFTWRESKFGSSMVELAHLTGDRQNVSLELDRPSVCLVAAWWN